MKRSRTQREKRKKKREARLQGQIGSGHLNRVFSAKSRSGDAARLSIAFSGCPVLVDPEQPEDLHRRSELAMSWDQTTKPGQN